MGDKELPAKNPEEKQDSEFISLKAMGERSHGRTENKPVSRLHIRKGGDVFTFMYHQLDSHAVFKGGEFVLLFAGAKHWQVTVKGSNLWKCYEYITLHRQPFIVEATRTLGAGDNDTVFESIEIKDVTPKLGES